MRRRRWLACLRCGLRILLPMKADTTVASCTLCAPLSELRATELRMQRLREQLHLQQRAAA